MESATQPAPVDARVLKQREWNRAWKKANPDKVAAQKKRYMARVLAAVKELRALTATALTPAVGA